jgi:hypothetical protein
LGTVEEEKVASLTAKVGQAETEICDANTALDRLLGPVIGSKILSARFDIPSDPQKIRVFIEVEGGYQIETPLKNLTVSRPASVN